MPNWCYNELHVGGTSDKLRRFYRAAKRGTRLICLQKFLPMPRELRNTQSPHKDTKRYKYLKEKFGQDNWYDWHVKNWGTKWDVNRESCHLDYNGPRSLIYVFDTAWSPPCPVLKKMSKKFKQLRFIMHFKDEGGGFEGTMTCKDGLCTEKIR